MWLCFTPFCCCCCEISALQAAAPVQLAGRVLLILLFHCCRGSTDPAVGTFPCSCALGGGISWFISASFRGMPWNCSCLAKETLGFGCSSGRDCPTGHWAGIFLFSGVFFSFPAPQGTPGQAYKQWFHSSVHKKMRIHHVFLSLSPVALSRQTAHACGLVECF